MIKTNRANVHSLQFFEIADEEWLSTNEITKFLSVAPSAVRIMVCRGIIPAVRMCGRLRIRKKRLHYSLYKKVSMKMSITSYLYNGNKFFEVYVNGTNARGKRTQKRKRGIESIRKAQEVEFNFERELAKAREEKVPLTWGEWIEIAIGQVKLEFRPSTVMCYEAYLKKWVTHWRDKDLKSITKQDVFDVVFRERDCELSPWTRRTLLKLIKRVLTMAVEQGELDRNPAIGIKVVVPEIQQSVLNPVEVKKLLAQREAGAK